MQTTTHSQTLEKKNWRRLRSRTSEYKYRTKKKKKSKALVKMLSLARSNVKTTDDTTLCPD